MANLSKLSDRRNEGLGEGSTSTTGASADFKGRSTTMLVRVFRFRGIGAGDIGHAITRHRHWRRRVGELAPRRRDWFGTIASVALASATVLEVIAWRRLLHMRARHADDARQKVLYLMSVSISDGVALTSRDISLINASLLGFEMKLAAFLAKPDRR
ncbi:hypothetical protein QFZ88_005333 [Mesorhizobium sp. YL-MeA3-2017]|jgi:hypothetical protein|nr:MULTISPECIES: hypothetical protein [Mesorhizobium]MBN9235710.1 hypothetical protein [Mesorhizobium sp.]MDQ0332951.1 hypothetical protein [Mesorhizobium sp. YL-MeA3-2017]